MNSKFDIFVAPTIEGATTCRDFWKLRGDGIEKNQVTNKNYFASVTLFDIICFKL